MNDEDVQNFPFLVGMTGILHRSAHKLEHLRCLFRKGMEGDTGKRLTSLRVCNITMRKCEEHVQVHLAGGSDVRLASSAIRFSVSIAEHTD